MHAGNIIRICAIHNGCLPFIILIPIIRSQRRCKWKIECQQKTCGNPAKWPGGGPGQQGSYKYLSMYIGGIDTVFTDSGRQQGRQQPQSTCQPGHLVVIFDLGLAICR
jgi:hypothetical protein